jgi:hypothetical protein
MKPDNARFRIAWTRHEHGNWQARSTRRGREIGLPAG